MKKIGPEKMPKTQDTFSVLLAISVRLYRDGLAALLSNIEGMWVHSAEDASAVVARAREIGPDIVLIDVRLPDAAGTLPRIAEVSPATRVVVLGVHETDAEIIAWAEAGVAGYVPVDASFESFVATLRSVGRGELLCSPRVAALLLQQVGRRREAAPSARSLLTRRELDIVTLIDQGASNKEIARELHIELSTVKNHVHHILEKLGASRRIQAAAHIRTLLAADTEPFPSRRL